MKPLTSDTVITVASGVKVEILDGVAWVAAGKLHRDCGPHALAVLDLFREPQSMAQAMAQLSVREHDPKVWMRFSATIYQLWETGVLRDANTPPAARGGAKTVGQSRVHAQVRMLHDRTRTHRFLRAIRETVKPGDIVLDLGSGSGVLGVAAAKAGAKHVYSMEMTGMADVAEAMFAASGYGERITLLRGRSNDLELPGQIKADVLITEIIGDGPLGEAVLETVTDARKRLLAPGARMVPTALTIGVVPLRLPADLLDRYIFTADNVQAWGEEYGIDFTAARRASDPGELTNYRLRTPDYLRCELLGPPAVLAHIDFTTLDATTLEASAQMRIEKGGLLHGVGTYFDLDISSNERLSTAPPGTQAVAVASDSCWRVPLSLRLQPLEVAAGDIFTVRFAYRGGESILEMTRDGNV